ncbi:MAG: energy-coupling factor ABC transporter ATP-binding protein [Spirochaetaceae bacterium]|jgi:cobalt/nickel transport system ATP-binding protein|nr:energy-coupling factor ABC transporter ATP-binding protein [Spirochaetaceae bacterium]
MSGERAALLKVSDLSVAYPGTGGGHVLEDVSFTVAEGERVALLGANGAGKSTLLLALLGIIEAHAGGIEIDGVLLEKKSLPLVRRKLGLLFQDPDDQLFMPTVYDDVVFGPRNQAENDGKAAEAGTEALIAEAADRMLAKLDILHLKDRMSHKLSGGEKRLAALASVLVTEPRMLLMDEPSAYLDPRARRRLFTLLGRLDEAFLVATHDLDLAQNLCGRCLLLHKGRLRADGPAKDIINDRSLLDECAL